MSTKTGKAGLGGKGNRRSRHGERSQSKAAPIWPHGVRLLPMKETCCYLPQELSVTLSREAFEQLFAYAYSTASEICCLGTVKQEGECFRVERFCLVPQSGSLGHTELDQEAVAALVEELLAQDKGEEAHSLKCWAHSHPGMDVFWSETDEATCKRLVTDYLLSLVVSDGFAIRCRIDVGGAVPFTIDHVPVVVEMPVQTDSLDKYAAEVEEKVRHRVPLLSVGMGKGAGHQEEVEVCEYCETCSSFHVQGQCLLTDDAFSQEAWDEYVRQCRAEGLEPEREEFEMYGDLDVWF